MSYDVQVLSIWEGTTNILSLDVLRAIGKSKGEVLVAFKSDIDARMSTVSNEKLSEAAGNVTEATGRIMRFIQENVSRPGVLELAARDLAFSLCRTYTGMLLWNQSHNIILY